MGTSKDTGKGSKTPTPDRTETTTTTESGKTSKVRGTNNGNINNKV